MKYVEGKLSGTALSGVNLSWKLVTACSLPAVSSYFAANNYIVSAEWNMYPRTLAGLRACYLAAVPFFPNSLISEAIASFLIFGLGSQMFQLSKVRTAAEARCQQACL